MFNIENKLLDKINKNIDIIFFIFITILALILRFTGMTFVSKDMEVHLTSWFNIIKSNGGFSSLSQQIGDYNVMYQTIIALLTYIDIEPVYLYKILSIIFDFLLAFSSAYLVINIRKEKKFSLAFNITYGLLLCLPIFVFNSSYWGQCDSIYTCFIIIALLQLFNNKYVSSFVFLGVALSFKLQTVFILPFYLIEFIKERKFSMLLFFIPVIVLIVSGLPGVICGRNIFDPISIYVNQISEYSNMSLNFNSYWNIVGNDYDYLGTLAILTTVFVIAIIYYMVLKKDDAAYANSKLDIAVLLTWSTLLFLPKMHERYDYLLAILLIILLVCKRRYYFSVIISLCITTITHSAFLFGSFNGGVTIYTTFIALFSYFSFTKEFYNEFGNTLIK